MSEMPDNGTNGWQTELLPVHADEIAPDGSHVRKLVALDRSSMAHFRLPPGATSTAVAHHSIEELWYVVGGRGEMWLGTDDGDEIVTLEPGLSIAIAPKTGFQFRTIGVSPLEIVGVSSPPWPGDDEAYEVDGAWTPS